MQIFFVPYLLKLGDSILLLYLESASKGWGGFKNLFRIFQQMERDKI